MWSLTFFFFAAKQLHILSLRLANIVAHFTGPFKPLTFHKINLTFVRPVLQLLSCVLFMVY